MTGHMIDPQAGKLDRRKVLLGIGLMAASGVAQARQPHPNKPRITKKAFEAMIPTQLGDFALQTESGLILPPKDALSDRLYDNLATRSYVSPAGDGAMLLVAYNNRQDGVLQIHRPEICYPAGGFELSPVEPIDIPLTPDFALKGQIFLAKSEVRNEVVFYWTRVGNAFPRRWIEQRIAVAEENIRGIIPDGVLARVSMIGNEIAPVQVKIERFVDQLYKSSNPSARALLFGDRALQVA